MSKLLLEGNSLKQDVAALTKRVERLEANLNRIVRQLEALGGRRGHGGHGGRSGVAAKDDAQGEDGDDIQCVVS